MCCEDVRIGKKILGASVDLVTLVTVLPLLPGNNDRHTLILNSAISGTMTYGINRRITSGAGINILAGDRPVILTLREHGAIVQLPWFAIHSAGGPTVTAFEGVGNARLCQHGE